MQSIETLINDKISNLQTVKNSMIFMYGSISFINSVVQTYYDDTNIMLDTNIDNLTTIKTTAANFVSARMSNINNDFINSHAASSIMPGANSSFDKMCDKLNEISDGLYINEVDPYINSMLNYTFPVLDDSASLSAIQLALDPIRDSSSSINITSLSKLANISTVISAITDMDSLVAESLQLLSKVATVSNFSAMKNLNDDVNGLDSQLAQVRTSVSEAKVEESDSSKVFEAAKIKANTLSDLDNRLSIIDANMIDI